MLDNTEDSYFCRFMFTRLNHLPFDPSIIFAETYSFLLGGLKREITSSILTCDLRECNVHIVLEFNLSQKLFLPTHSYISKLEFKYIDHTNDSSCS